MPTPSAEWAVFLDLDGTLLDIVPRPDCVLVPATLPGDLVAAHAALRGGLAVVTGRSIAMLDSLLAPAKLPAAGCHGAELRSRPGSATLCLAPAPSPALLVVATAQADAEGIAAARALGGDGLLLGRDTAAGPADIRAWLAALPQALDVTR